MSVRDLIPWGRERNAVARNGDALDPFISLHREMNRLFDDVFRGFGSGFGGRFDLPDAFAGWPSLDVVESDKDYRVTVDLPGLDEKDIELALADGVLTVRGEKKVERDAGGALRAERFHGRFERSLALGSDVDESKVTASFRNGVLDIVLPKTADAGTRTRRIPIATA